MSKFRLSPEAFRAQRIKAGVSREQAAVAVERAYETLVGYESGKIKPPVEIVLTLADLYGCQLSDLIEAVEPEPAA